MAITSPTQGCLEVNDQTCETLGYGRNELLQMTWAQITHPDDLDADVANFKRLLAGEVDGYSMDKRFIRKDGRVIDTTISVKCVRFADGSVDYFVALLQVAASVQRLVGSERWGSKVHSSVVPTRPQRDAVHEKPQAIRPRPIPVHPDARDG